MPLALDSRTVTGSRAPGAGREVPGRQLGGQVVDDGDLGVVDADDDLGVKGAPQGRRTGSSLILPLNADDSAGQLAKVRLLGLGRAALVDLTPGRRVAG